MQKASNRGEGGSALISCSAWLCDVCDVCVCVYDVLGQGPAGAGGDQRPTHGCNLMENCPVVPVQR